MSLAISHQAPNLRTESDINLPGLAYINSNTGGFLYYGTLSVTPITTFTDVTYGSSLYLVTT